MTLGMSAPNFGVSLTRMEATLKRIPLVVAAALLSIAVVPVNAADWLDRTVHACTFAQAPSSDCARATQLVRTAMAAANHAGNGRNGASDHDSVLERAASAVAAYVVLERHFPDQEPEFERLLAIQLADIPETQQKADALARGRGAAEKLLAGAR